MVRHIVSVGRLGVALFALLLFCSPRVAAGAGADAAAKYYAEAKKEGKLVIYGLGEPFLGPIKAAFSKQYPGIQLEAFDESGRETRERIIAEQKTGRIIGDIIIAGAGSHVRLEDLGFLQQYESSQKSAIIPELVPPGSYANPFRATVFSMAINTKLVPPADEPKAWADVLLPKFKGKISSDDPRGGGGGGGTMATLEKAFGAEFLRKLAAQNIFFGRDTGTTLTALVRGEHALFLTASHDDLIVLRKDGAPVKFLKPQEGIRVSYAPQSIIKNAPHTNAAKLWVEWSTSEEGQQMLGKSGLAPVRKGVAAAEPEANLVGVKILPLVESRQDLTYLKERTQRYEAIFFKKN